jgi:hypothetical protein
MEKVKHDIDFDWLDSNTLVLDNEGIMTVAGTAIKLNQNIIFLKPLSKDQLIELKKIVNSAVDHELAKRE